MRINTSPTARRQGHALADPGDDVHSSSEEDGVRETLASAAPAAGRSESDRDEQPGARPARGLFERKLFWITYALCALPFALNLLGADFGMEASSTGQEQHQHGVTGEMLHAILEWSAVCLALFTACLTLVHYKVTGNVVSPIIGMALFWSGAMDAFHILTASHVIGLEPLQADFMPATWAISRTFHAAIPLAGAAVLLGRKRQTVGRRDLRLFLGMGLLFGLIAFVVIHFSATSGLLPSTVYPGHVIKRPFDVIPLLLYLLGGAVVYRALHARFQTVFSAALWIGVIPGIFTQAYMAFGSEVPFDNGFNVAHFLKILIYLVPCAGLGYDYIFAHQGLKTNLNRLRWAHGKLFQRNSELIELNKELQDKNKELDEFSYVASHDLQEPLRKLTTFSQMLEKDMGDGLNDKARRDLDYITDAAGRMRSLVEDLLRLSRSGKAAMKVEEISLEECADRAIKALELRLDEAGAVLEREELPTINGDFTMLTQLYQNLIGNALKFRGPEPPRIRLTATGRDGDWVLGVEDNGIGIKPEFREQIFAPFKRLHGRAQFDGSGIGLAICSKTVKRHGGEIWVESEPDRGSRFIFTLRGNTQSPAS